MYKNMENVLCDCDTTGLLMNVLLKTIHNKNGVHWIHSKM